MKLFKKTTALLLIAVMCFAFLLPQNFFLAVTAAPTPVAHYTFDDAQNIGKDSIGTKHLVSGNNAVLVDSKIEGKAVQLAGASSEDCLSLSGNFTKSYTNFSVSVYAKLEKEVTDFACLVSTGWSTAGGFSFGLGANNKVFFEGTNIINQKVSYTASANVTQLNKWHMYTLTLSDSGRVLKIYVDNVLVLTKNLRAKLKLTNSADVLVVGQRENKSSYKFKGCIDELKIFSKGISEAEVSAIFKEPAIDDQLAGIPENSLVSQYEFNDPQNIGKDTTGRFDLNNGSGVTLTTTQSGGSAANFGGVATTDCLYYDGENYTTTLNNFTISVLARLGSEVSDNACLFSTGWDPSGGISFGLRPGNEFFLDATLQNGETVWINFNSKVSQTKDFHLYTVVVSNDGKKIEIYVDDILLHTKELTLPLKMLSSLAEHKLAIGQAAWRSGYMFNGAIDEVRIYNYPLKNNAVSDMANAFGTAKPPVVIPDNSLVASYNFESLEEIGKDEQGRFDLTNRRDVTVVKGKNGNGAHFAGKSEYDALLFDGANYTENFTDMTVSFYAKLDHDVSDNACVIATGWDPNGGFAFGFTPGNGLFFDSTMKNGKKVWINGNAGTSTVKGLHLYTLTITNGGKCVNIYVDGSEVASEKLESPINYKGKYGIVIGQAAWYGGYIFNGVLDELKIYNYGMSESEVASMAMAAGAVQPPVVIPANSLVASYSFDKLETIGKDAQGRFDLTNRGNVTVVKGKKGDAAHFDGKNGLDALYFDGTNFTKDFSDMTISFYAKLDHEVTDNACVIATGWDPNGGFAFGFRPGNEFFFDSTMKNGKTVWISGKIGTSPVNAFHFYTLTITKGGKCVNIYVDGLEVASVELESPVNYKGKHGLVVGQAAWYDGYLFNGVIDELKIYNYGMSANDVAKVAGVMVNSDPTLIAYYSFDDSSEIGRDSLGKYHLTNEGGVVAYKEGFSGGAAYFPGIDWKDTLSYKGPNLTKSLTEFTIGCYAKSEIEVKDNTCLFSTGWDGVGGFSFGLRPKNRIFVDAETNAKTVVWKEDMAGANAIEDYHHYALSYSAAKKLVNYYVDGKLVQSVKLNGPLNLTAKYNITLGQVAWKNGYIFRGWMDEFKIYNVFMDEVKIAESIVVKNEVTEDEKGEKPQNSVDKEESSSQDSGTSSGNAGSNNTTDTKVTLPDEKIHDENTKTEEEVSKFHVLSVVIICVLLAIIVSAIFILKIKNRKD